jgi:WD40 repeat protein
MWDVETGDILLQASLYEYSVPWSLGSTMDLAVDHTGNTAVTVDPDNIIYLWDLKGALEARRFSGHQDWVASMTFTPDGKQLVTGAVNMAGIPNDTSIRLWDVASGEQLRIYEGHENGILDLAVSHDGRWILSGSADGSMRLWDLETGEQVQNIFAHTNGVFDVSISPDGYKAISGSLTAGNPDDGVAVWDLVSGELLHDLRNSGGNSTQSRFISDGQSAYTVRGDKLVLIDMITGKYLREYDFESFDFALHPDDETVIYAGVEPPQVIRLDLETEQIIQGYGPHPGSRSMLDLSADGKLLLTSVSGGTLHLWDVESGDELLRFNSNCYNLYIDMNPDGQYAVTCGPNNVAILWDLRLPIEVNEVVEWIAANRYVRELTCEERAKYGVAPLCGEE